MPKSKVIVHLRASKVEKAIFQAQFFIDRIALIELKRQWFCSIQDFNRIGINFYKPCGRFQVFTAGWASSYFAPPPPPPPLAINAYSFLSVLSSACTSLLRFGSAAS